MTDIKRIETQEIGAINYEQEQIRLSLRRLELAGDLRWPAGPGLRDRMAGFQKQYAEQVAKLTTLRQSLTASVVISSRT